jgi:cytochrome c551
VLGSVKNRYYIYILCVIIISSCYSNEKQQDGKSLSFSERIKLKQYKVQGKLLYTQYCANCHQADGSGLGKLIPPISASHRVKSDNSSVICIIKYGMEGAVEVNGVQYDGKMPANFKLTNLEIAEISTFIGNSWKNSIGIVTSNEVEKALLVCN